MKNLMSESEVKRQLGITDFRHLKKDQVIQLASMIDSMEPEVAMKALEQFPEFGRTISELAGDYKNVLEKALSSNDESMRENEYTLRCIIESLLRLAEREDISFEERKYYIEKVMEIQKLLSEKDTENKNFIGKVTECGKWIVLGLAAFTLAAIGGKVRIKDPFHKDDDDSGKYN